MMTQTHLIFGLAAFGKPGQGKIVAAALLGSFVPDASLYLLAGTHLTILGTPPQVVFDELYYSDNWQAIFRVDNSFVIWGMILSLAIVLKSRVAVALAGAAILHLMLDFPLHNDDARAHFWPITDWKFISPVSYWDARHYGHLVAPIEIVGSLFACVWLWRRHHSKALRVLVAVLAALQVSAGSAFAISYLT